MLGLLGDEVRTAAPGTGGKRQGPVKGFLKNVERAAGGLPLRRMPNWLRPIVGWLMPRVGPKGLEFARARVEMKAVETVLHLRREKHARMKNMVPKHIWPLVAPYGLTPQEGERATPQSTHATPAAWPATPLKYRATPHGLFPARCDGPPAASAPSNPCRSPASQASRP